MIIALFLVAILARAVVLVFDEIRRAPAGYEDEDGFHFGIHPNCAVLISNQTTEPAADFMALEDKVLQRLENKPAGSMLHSRIPWIIKGAGIAALFVALSGFLPKPYKNIEITTPRPKTAAPSIQAFAEADLPSNNWRERSSARITSEPSRLIQTFCQRSTRAE